MLEIEFEVPEELGGKLAEQYMQGMLRDVADMAYAEIVRLASESLGSLKSHYIKGVQPPVVMGDTAIIELHGKFPEQIEHGHGPYDMRETLLGPGNKKVRVAQDGTKYAYIPFSHRTPRAGGMPSSVFKEAKKLEPTVSMPFHKVKYGDSLRGGIVAKYKPHHRSDIYKGMLRMAKDYEKGTQSTYMTFRTISDGVKTGWYRKAMPAHKFFSRVEAFIEQHWGAMVASNPPINFT